MTSELLYIGSNKSSESFETQEKPGIAFEPYVSVVIPAFNEEDRIRGTLVKWVQFMNRYYSKDHEILVVMDGCTDRTIEIVSKIAIREKGVVAITRSERLEKGGALIEAFKQSRGQILFFTDADCALPVEEIFRFLKESQKSDLVIGCRYFRGSEFANSIPLSRLVASRVFNALLRVLFHELENVHDTQCGAKAIRKEAALATRGDLFVTDYAFDVNLIYSALRRGFKVQEINVMYNHEESNSKVSPALWRISLTMLFSVVRLRVYYSRWKELLYDNRTFRRADLIWRKMSNYC